MQEKHKRSTAEVKAAMRQTQMEGNKGQTVNKESRPLNTTLK